MMSGLRLSRALQASALLRTYTCTARQLSTSIPIIQESRVSRMNSSLRRIYYKLPIIGKAMIKEDICAASTRLYICLIEHIDFNEFMEKLEIPDTFTAWAKIVQLHSWMLSLRLLNLTPAEVDDTRQEAVMRSFASLYCEEFNKSMWKDVEYRAKELCRNRGSWKPGFYQLSAAYQVSAVTYEEGLKSGDTHLSEALWNNIFEGREDIDPTHLALLIDYVHKNIFHLFRISDRDLQQGLCSFLSLDEKELNSNKTRLVHEYALKL